MRDGGLRRIADACLLLTAGAIPLSTSAMEIGIAALFALALVAWARGDGVVRRTALDVPLALCAATFAVSTLASGVPWQAVGWLRLWVVIGYFGILWWMPDAAAAERFVRWLVAAAVVAAAYGIVQHFTGIEWYRDLLGRAHVVRPRIAGAEGYASVGFFRSYLTYAHVLVLPLGFALAAQRPATRLVAVPLLAVAILVSSARGACLAAAAMAAALLCTTPRAGRVVLAIVAAAALAWIVSPGLRAQIVPAITVGETNAGRLEILAANRDIVHDHPVLGLGFGRYQRAATPYYDRHPGADRRSHAHNNFLQIAAESGLLGLAAFTFLFATALRRGIEAVRRTHDPALRATALGGCLALTGFLVGGLTQYSFGDSEVAIAMWATLAVLMRLRESA